MMTDVATCTSRCWIMPQYILDCTGCKKRKDDKYFYVEITGESMIANPSLQNVKSSPLRCSLFPYVAPYVKFCTFDAKGGSEMPRNVTKHLKFNLVNQHSSNIVRRTFIRSGCSLTNKSSDSCGIWGKQYYNKRSSRSNDPVRFQKVNRIPGTLQLSCKDKLWRHVNFMAGKFGKKAFGFIPKTYILPKESWRLRRDWEESRGKKWIVKPPKADRGDGIRVVNEWSEIPKYRSMVVQRYLSKPRLIRGQKFDIRLYVLVTSFNPLRIYLYRDGLVRFATMRYIDGGNYLTEKCMHLTNTNINRTNVAYRVPSSVDSQSGHLWSLKTLWKYLKKCDDSVDVNGIWSEMKDIVVKTLISGEPSVGKVLKSRNPSRYNCFEILGFDVILDRNYKPWLLEVNRGPSMSNDTPVESYVKGSLLKDALNMAGYQLPNTLSVTDIQNLSRRYQLRQVCHDSRIFQVNISEEERRKQEFFAGCKNRADYLTAILETLTPDDARHLITYEDELTQIGNFEKVFPTVTSHIYFRYFNPLRYYNMLFDAWETRHGSSRNSGISRLQKLCRERYHLITAG